VFSGVVFYVQCNGGNLKCMIFTVVVVLGVVARSRRPNCENWKNYKIDP
jgi:hypothetical protein